MPLRSLVVLFGRRRVALSEEREPKIVVRRGADLGRGGRVGRLHQRLPRPRQVVHRDQRQTAVERHARLRRVLARREIISLECSRGVPRREARVAGLHVIVGAVEGIPSESALRRERQHDEEPSDDCLHESLLRRRWIHASGSRPSRMRRRSAGNNTKA